jgi:hypothetical protein
MSAVAAGIIAGGAVLSAGISAYSSGQAANKQAQSAQNSLNLQQGMYDQTVGYEAPYRDAGTGATSQLNYLLGTGTPGAGNTAASSPAGGFGSLNAPFTGDMMKQYSPAYQFQMQQGQQNVLNQTAGQSGALSGAALKDLTSFNQGYANTAFNNAFSQYQTQQSNTFNRLAGIAQLGQAASSNQASGASNFGSSIGSAAQNIGTAQAGGIVGASNAITGGINSATPWLYAGGGGSGGWNFGNSDTTDMSGFATGGG